MNRKKATILTVTGLAIAPAISASALLVTSCSNANSSSKGISVSTKDVEVNHNTGVGEFDVILDEQPEDNAAYVYIITAEGAHHVELLDVNARLYNGSPAVLYKVENGVAHVQICFTEFVGESTSTVVSIDVRYNSRSGKWVKKSVSGINVSTKYVQNNKEQVHIISLNDFHGAAAGYGEPQTEFPGTNAKNPGAIRIMNEISPIIEDHPGSFLVTAGDNNSGNMYSTAVHGESMFKTLKAMGARYSAVGNHAFEWGISPMATYEFDRWARTEDTTGNYFVASNILNGKLDNKDDWESDPTKDDFEKDYTLWQSQRVEWADPYKIVNMNGHLVCLIGLTTKATLEDGNKEVVDNLSFIDYNAAVNYSIYFCEHDVEESLFNSIESFVLLTHVESKVDATGKGEGAAVELAEEVKNPKIDAIISGHSHETVNVTIHNNNTGKYIKVGQAETEGRKYLDLCFHYDNTKPIGQKLDNVTMQINDMTLNVDYDEAARGLKQIRDNPSTEKVKTVIDTFDTEKEKVFTALKEPLANRSGSLLYPGIHVEGGLGHAYYMNDRYWNKHKDQTGNADDGGYIVDQLGAWMSYAQLVGFASYYFDEIKKSSAGLTWPVLSLTTIDSMKIEYQTPTTAEERKVTLKDMYDLQTYENTMVFGYLSIWQIANIINHSLAGRNRELQTKFNYSAPQEEYYTPNRVSGRTPTVVGSLNDLANYQSGYIDGDTDKGPHYQVCCYKDSYPIQPMYKDMPNVACLYVCGPLQSYGMRMHIEECPAPYLNDRVYKLKTRPVDPEADADLVAKGISWFPDIEFIDPLIRKIEVNSVDDLYEYIQIPTNWISAKNFYRKYGEYVPTVMSSFLFGGANNQLTMMKPYMDFNESLDWRSYPVMKFSQLSRDMMIEFCHVTDTYREHYQFDMPLETVSSLVVTPTPS